MTTRHARKPNTHLITVTDLLVDVSVFLDTQNTSKTHEALMIKAIWKTHVVAVSCKIIPLVNVNSILLICNHLQQTSTAEK